MHMMFNFQVNQHLFYALAASDTRPLAKALEATRARPASAQWGVFLRNHDELDLGRLAPAQRQRVFQEFAPDPDMQLYDRGIRRRLAPMLNGDRRSRARTPMQWSTLPNAGFSGAEKTAPPVISEGPFGYGRVNVADQRRDHESLLNWTERVIRMRKECPQIGWGDFSVLRTQREVLALRYAWRNNVFLALHNVSAKPASVRLSARDAGDDRLVSLFTDDHSSARNGRHEIELDGYAYRWYRVGGLDDILR